MRILWKYKTRATSNTDLQNHGEITLRIHFASDNSYKYRRRVRRSKSRKLNYFVISLFRFIENFKTFKYVFNKPSQPCCSFNPVLIDGSDPTIVPGFQGDYNQRSDQAVRPERDKFKSSHFLAYYPFVWCDPVPENHVHRRFITEQRQKREEEKTTVPKANRANKRARKKEKLKNGIKVGDHFFLH